LLFIRDGRVAAKVNSRLVSPENGLKMLRSDAEPKEVFHV
jgi:hypothetical protein